MKKKQQYYETNGRRTVPYYGFGFSIIWIAVCSFVCLCVSIKVDFLCDYFNSFPVTLITNSFDCFVCLGFSISEASLINIINIYHIHRWAWASIPLIMYRHKLSTFIDLHKQNVHTFIFRLNQYWNLKRLEYFSICQPANCFSSTVKFN